MDLPPCVASGLRPSHGRVHARRTRRTDRIGCRAPSEVRRPTAARAPALRAGRRPLPHPPGRTGRCTTARRSRRPGARSPSAAAPPRAATGRGTDLRRRAPGEQRGQPVVQALSVHPARRLTADLPGDRPLHKRDSSPASAASAPAPAPSRSAGSSPPTVRCATTVPTSCSRCCVEVTLHGRNAGPGCRAHRKCWGAGTGRPQARRPVPPPSTLTETGSPARPLVNNRTQEHSK